MRCTHGVNQCTGLKHQLWSASDLDTALRTSWHFGPHLQRLRQRVNARTGCGLSLRGEAYTQQNYLSLHEHRSSKPCLSVWPPASCSLSWREEKQGDKRSVLVATFSCHSQYPRHTPTQTHTRLHTDWEMLLYFSHTMLCLIRVVMWTKAAGLSATADLWVLKFWRETS